MTGEDRPAAEVIDERLALFRAALEVCAAEGFDPAEVTLASYRLGAVEMFPGYPYPPEDRALAVLARLTDAEPRRVDLTAASSYQAAGVAVYAELHPDAPRDEDATPGPGAAR